VLQVAGSLITTVVIIGLFEELVGGGFSFLDCSEPERRWWPLY
jgi:hypothetical protein